MVKINTIYKERFLNKNFKFRYYYLTTDHTIKLYHNIKTRLYNFNLDLINYIAIILSKGKIIESNSDGNFINSNLIKNLNRYKVKNYFI